MDQKVNTTHTCCRNCIFAIWHGRTQTDCKLGRTEKFKEQGCLLEATDNEKDFFLINGRNCKAYRNITWVNQVKLPTDEFPAKVREEIAVKIDVVIFIPDADLESLKRTIESVKTQKPKPLQVLFVNNQDTLPRHKVITFLRQQCQDLDWKLTHIIQRNEDGSRMSREQATDIVFPNVRGDYYTVVSAGTEFPNGFISAIDVALNDNLERFSLLTPTPQGEFMVVQSFLHPLLHGNRPIERISDDEGSTVLDTLEEKVEHFASEQDSNVLVKQVSDVCQTLS